MPRLPGLLNRYQDPRPIYQVGGLVYHPGVTGRGARPPSRSQRRSRPGRSPDGSG
nr:MAG TPA: hypothetical protein [Caudoviricetes sp.]